MKIIKFNYKNNTDKVLINRLQHVSNEKGMFKPYFQEFEKMLETGELVLLIALDTNNDITGFSLLKVKSNSVVIEFLEAFRKRIGVGTELLNYIKNHYGRIEAEALKNATDFYIKNGFELTERYKFRDLVIWTKSS